jgi:hypothetical protein
MARRVAKPAVTTRLLAPETAEEIPPGLLYHPVPQVELVDGEPPFDISYEWITPEQAGEYLQQAANASDFRQRPLSFAEVKRWANLVDTDRFVHYLPNGVVCFDEEGILLNGQHRFNGLAEGTKPAAFIVFRNVPRWMFAYFDTNKHRTTKNVLHINNRVTGPQTDSALKLSLRYEEFLQGVRTAMGWRHWNAVRDEHQDVDDFYARRQDIQQGYALAQRVYSKSKVLIPSVMAFYFYQSLAWPEGIDCIESFLNELTAGTRLNVQRPMYHLQRFTQEVFENKSPMIAKREVHLMLLMRVFTQEMNNSRVGTMHWAYGQPMVMPYHPKGHEVAIKTVRSALDEIDREATE